LVGGRSLEWNASEDDQVSHTPFQHNLIALRHTSAERQQANSHFPGEPGQPVPSSVPPSPDLVENLWDD